MTKPTIDDMKLAVALLLPDRLHIRGAHACWRLNERTAGPAVMETEWLYICWLAEQTLNHGERWDYQQHLLQSLSDGVDRLHILHASAELRIEGLWRISLVRFSK